MLNLIHAFIEQSNPQLTRYKLLDAVNFPIAVDSTVRLPWLPILSSRYISRYISRVTRPALHATRYAQPAYILITLLNMHGYYTAHKNNWRAK